jgi:GxxExxY protein
VKYKGFCVREGHLDLLVGGELIVELKSVEQLAAVHVAQVISYLKAFDRPPGLLITFNVKLLRNGVRRVDLSLVRVERSNTGWRASFVRTASSRV